MLKTTLIIVTAIALGMVGAILDIANNMPGFW